MHKTSTNDGFLLYLSKHDVLALLPLLELDNNADAARLKILYTIELLFFQPIESFFILCARTNVISS